MNLMLVNCFDQSWLFDGIYWSLSIWNLAISVTFIIIPYWLYQAGFALGVLSLCICMFLRPLTGQDLNPWYDCVSFVLLVIIS